MQIDVPGMGLVEFPDGMSDDQISTAIKRNASIQNFEKRDPKIGQPEDLSFAEKYVAPLLEKAGQAVTGNPGGLEAEGVSRGGWAGRLAQGSADPGVSLVQLGANAISPLVSDRGLTSLVTGQDDSLAGRVNRAIAEHEKQYQAARAGAGSTGFDPLRMAGNVAITAPLAGLGGGAASTLGQIGKGALQGGAFGALQPVEDAGDSFLKQKLKQVGIGALAGGVTAPLVSALARVVSPNASLNPDLKLLKSEGVQPSIGQALGGAANTVEEKLQSLPIMGDAITAMRKRALDQFNEAATNRAVSPVGATINKGTGGGFKTVAAAGDLLSGEYDSALNQIGKVKFDTPAFNQSLQDVQVKAQGLSEPLQQKLGYTFKNVVLRRMDSNGVMTGEAFKKADSELGQLVARFGRGNASEQEFADAAKLLQDALKQEVMAAHPQVGAKLAAADEGWANLVRLEGAAKAAKNRGGVYTPAELNSAIQGADRSVRGRAVSRGEALMQDLGNAGQNVLGNKYPDSGTIGRGAMAAGALGAGAINLAIPGALIGGAAAYTPPVQNFLVALVSKRPDMAPKVANYLRQLTMPATAVTVPMLEQQFR